MTTSVAALNARRASARAWTRDGSTGTERMSAAPGVCSGRAPSPEPEPTRGFVATKRPWYWPPCSDPLGAASEQRERGDEGVPPARVEQVVVVEVRVHVARQRRHDGAGEGAEGMRGRQDTGRRLPAARRAVDEPELRDGRAHSIVGVPAAAAEVARVEAALPHPFRLVANTRRGIAVDRPRMRGARPVRVQAEWRAGGSCACALEPRFLRLAVLRIGGTHERDHVEAPGAAALEPVEALPGGVVQRTLDVARRHGGSPG